jgi:plasmid stability protein
MSRMIQIRNVPDELHRKLKSRAALAGMSLSDYLRREVERVADRPSPEEIGERLRTRRPVRTRLSPARAVREERDRR